MISGKGAGVGGWLRRGRLSDDGVGWERGCEWDLLHPDGGRGFRRGAEATPLRGRFKIYKDLRIFLTRKFAKISPCLEGSCSLCLRESDISNIRSKSLGWEFGRFPLFPKSWSQACQGFREFVKLGF